MISNVLCLFSLIVICRGNLTPTAKTSEICGDWTSYKEEKCLKIAGRAGPQTQPDSEVICKTYADDPNKESPRLLTIRSKEEQDFVKQFLFVENQLVDHVWLGLTKNRNSGLFEWNDGSQVTFSNWSNQTIEDNEHECVEMESGEGSLPSGVWFKVNCRRKNTVVCEKRPVWSFVTLENAFLNFKLEQELKQKEWERKFGQSEREIKTLKNNPVPIGFIYIQLFQQDLPTILWPSTQWAEISSNYSGNFFRVVGGNSAEFGQIQEETSPRLKQVQYIVPPPTQANPISVPADGQWSDYIYSGQSCSNCVALRFQLSADEVRPRNQAVKIWQRVR